jgi:hypothetical protein
MKAREALDEIRDVPLRQRLREAVPVLVPEVRRAYLAWRREVPGGVLIGALACGAYSSPRTTFDVDLLFLSEADVPAQVPGFRRIKPLLFEHINTHGDFDEALSKYVGNGVKVDILLPEPGGFSTALAQQIFDTAHHGVASEEGVIAAKLQRCQHNDSGDIERIIQDRPDITFEGWPLSDAQRQILAQIRASPRHETPPDE